MFRAFKEYSKNNNLPALNRDYFFKHIHDKDIIFTEERRGKEGERRRVYVGIRLLNRKDVGHVGHAGKDVQSVHCESNLRDSFTELSSEKKSFGFCEYCGEHRELAFENQDRRLACKVCAGQ